MSDFDLIIVGTGVSGQSAAEVAAPAGLRVATVDVREYGGTCALRGCEPKKTLFTGAEPVHRVRAQHGDGVVGDVRVDWHELVEFKRTFTSQEPRHIEDWLSGMGVTTLHGLATFTSPTTMRIGEQEYTGDDFIIASGAKPSPLGIPGEELVIDSEGFMDLDELPPRVAFIGGGYISFEFAHMALAAGAKPVILHRSDHPLRGFDPELVERLVRGYRDRGIEIRLNAPVREVRRASAGVADPSRDAGAGAPIEILLGDGGSVFCDLAVHGAGREAELSRLSLEDANVTYGRHGIDVDVYMRSVFAEHVYAVGDAAALGLPLTPVGIAQGRIAARNVIEPGSATFEPVVTPSVVFADPPLAAVGMTAAEAETETAEGRKIDVKFTDTSEWASSRRVGLRHTAIKTMIDRDSGRLLGAHVLGHNAEEFINLFALAIARHATSDELQDMLWAYPTIGREIVYVV